MPMGHQGPADPGGGGVAGSEETDIDGEDLVYEAAAGWVARLSSSDSTDADRRAFEKWRSANPAHAEAYAEMDAMWHKLGRLPDPRRRPGTPKTLTTIAIVALVAGALVYQQGLFDWLRADLWSGVGNVEHARLADGSRVDLNTDTAIALHFTEQERGIELLRGEASFDVVPDPDRPFTVRSNGLSIRAVGTRFFVRADGSENPVGVAEGRVDVSAAGHRAIVTAGEAVKISADTTLSVTTADVERRMAWRDGRLIFAGQPLSTVLAELDRYRHGRILLMEYRLGERRVTGAFDLHDTDEALDVLAATMGVRVRRLSPLLVLVGPPF